MTNTIWWQDFPRRSAPDYSSLFTQFHNGETNQDTETDFASQLAGFMASLLTDVPSQAQWIAELAKYDFGGATGHLIASVPGVHSYKTPYILESRHFGRVSVFICVWSNIFLFEWEADSQMSTPPLHFLIYNYSHLSFYWFIGLGSYPET